VVGPAQNLAGIESSVSIDRSQVDEEIINYSIDISGELTKSEKEKLLSIAKTCAVHKTLSKKISFKSA